MCMNEKEDRETAMLQVSIKIRQVLTQDQLFTAPGRVDEK